MALRAENVRLGERGPANVFSGRVLERRYQGMQTVYDVDMGGQRIEALELGTAARHEQNGEVAITLPPETCWAYRDDGRRSIRSRSLPERSAGRWRVSRDGGVMHRRADHDPSAPAGHLPARAREE